MSFKYFGLFVLFQYVFFKKTTPNICWFACNLTNIPHCVYIKLVNIFLAFIQGESWVRLIPSLTLNLTQYHHFSLTQSRRKLNNLQQHKQLQTDARQRHFRRHNGNPQQSGGLSHRSTTTQISEPKHHQSIFH